MRFYRLFTVALLLSITGFSFALTPSTQESLNSAVMTKATSGVNSPSENQSLWLTEQIILLNNKITTLESQLPNSKLQSTENRQTLAQLKNSLGLIKTEQIKLQIAIEQSIVENSQQYENQNNRISDAQSGITFWGILFTLFSLIIVVGTLGLGYFAKNNAIDEAKKEAEKVAKEEACAVSAKAFTAWIENNEEKIIDDVVERTEEKLSEVAALKEMIEEYKTKMEEGLKEIRSRTSQIDKPQNPSDIALMEQNLQSKPEREYSPQEWLDKSLTAHYANDFHRSIKYLNIVIDDVRSADELIVIALFNKAIASLELKMNDIGIGIYEELITRFIGRSELGLQEYVAKALNNKGVELKMIGRSEEAIACYNTLISCFTDSEELTIQESVVMAFKNKENALHELKNYKDAIKTDDELIGHISNKAELILRENIALIFGECTANAAEISLLYELTDEILKRVKLAEDSNKDNVQTLVMMKFLRFLIGDMAIESMLPHIKEFPQDKEFNWTFDIMRSYLENITGNKKLQALAVVDFFENHLDFEKLKKECADIESSC